MRVSDLTLIALFNCDIEHIFMKMMLKRAILDDRLSDLDYFFECSSRLFLLGSEIRFSFYEKNKVLECSYPTRRPNDIDSHSTIWGRDTHVTHHGYFW